MPKAIAGAPTLQLGLDLYYSAFIELSSERASGFSAGPIPWSAIRSYAKDYHYNPEQVEWLNFLVRSLDNTYLKWEGNKSANK